MTLYPQIFKQIINKLNFYEILNVQKCNKLLYKIGLQYIVVLPKYAETKITNKKLLKYIYLKYLNLSFNKKVTTSGIKHLKKLERLTINKNFNLDIELLKDLSSLKFIMIDKDYFFTTKLLREEIYKHNLNIYVGYIYINYSGDYVFPKIINRSIMKIYDLRSEKNIFFNRKISGTICSELYEYKFYYEGKYDYGWSKEKIKGKELTKEEKYIKKKVFREKNRYNNIKIKNNYDKSRKIFHKHKKN